MAEVEEHPYFEVSAEAATKCVGFAIDAGGSATKLVYRSKQDYCETVPINPKIPSAKGFLRCVTLASTNIDIDKLADFIEKECDIAKDPMHKTVYCTGIFTQALEKTMMERFGLTLHRTLEYDYMLDALHHLIENGTLSQIVHDTDIKGIAYGTGLHNQNKEVRGMQAAGLSRGGIYSKSYEWKTKEEPSTNEDSNSSSVLHPPFILALLGSAVSHHKVESDWSNDLVEFASFGGRTFLSVCGVISRKNESFDDIIEQSTVGNRHNVDVTSGDTKVTTSEDMYGEVDNEFPYFYFGKPACKDPESFEKEDLLASWTNAYCASQATYTHLVALAHGVDKVLMIGGLCNNPLVRQHITKFWYSRLLHAKGKKIGLYFVKNGQLLCALGACIKGSVAPTQD